MEIKIGKQFVKEQLDNTYTGKKLPNMFNSEDKLSRFIVFAVVFHVLMVGLMYVCINVLGIHFSLLDKPEWQTKDIEFVLTENEAEPINKNTKYRSDKNSRAGGIHDPKKVVSMPSSAPSPAPKQVSTPSPAPVPPKPQSAPKTQAPKPQQKPVQEVQKGVSRPSKAVAPTAQRPVLKPSATPAKPQMPKLASAPNSPFKVAVPNTGAPVGRGFSTSNGTASTGGGSVGSPQGTGTKGSGMPAPQFSTTKVGTSSGKGASSGSSSKSGSGGYGTGNMGNPGPGNPNGAPGIDAIKAPQWGPYMRALESKIKQNWHPPKGDRSKRVVLNFKIGKRGELLSVVVAKSSGSPENDNAAVKAVQMSAPFRALPPEYTKSSVDINFTFDYTVLGATSYR